MRPGAVQRNFATSKLLLSVIAMIMFVENGRDEERMETIKWLNLSRTRLGPPAAGQGQLDTLQTGDTPYNIKCSLKSTFTRAKDQRSKNCEILIFIRIKISKIKVLWSKNH